MADLGDLQRGIERVSDQIVRDAMAEGEFDVMGLPGAGKPLEGIDEPFDEHWWVRRWVRREGLHTPTVAQELQNAAARRAAAGQPSSKP